MSHECAQPGHDQHRCSCAVSPVPMPSRGRCYRSVLYAHLPMDFRQVRLGARIEFYERLNGPQGGPAS